MKEFRYWWTNIFWYHYKRTVFVCIFIAVLLFGIIYSIVTNVTPDYIVAVASKARLIPEMFNELQDVIAEHAGDRNGDGKLSASVQVIDTGDNEGAQATRVKFTVLMMDEEFILMFLDRQSLNQYAAGGEALEPLENLGLEADEPTGYGIRVDQWPIFVRAAVSDYANILDTEFYACFKSTAGKEMAPEMKERYDYAKSLLKHLEAYP